LPTVKASQIGDGRARAGQRVALGAGIEIAPQGSPPALLFTFEAAAKTGAMKIPRFNRSRPHRQSGSAVLLFITLLAIMLMLITANGSALLHLHRELKLLDQRTDQTAECLADQRHHDRHFTGATGIKMNTDASAKIKDA